MKIPVASSFYTESIVHAAYLHKLQKRYDQAISMMEQALQYKDNVPQFYVLFASFLDDTKQYTRAISMLKNGVTKISDNAQMHFFLGSMYDRMDMKEQVIEEMLTVLKLEPTHVHALNYLAYTYAELNRNLEDAEQYAMRAIEQMPNDGYVLDTYGWVLFKRGQVGTATKILEKAIGKQPNESIIAEHLGDVYFNQQLAEKARRMYQLAIEKESNAKVQKKLREKIAAIDNQKGMRSVSTIPRVEERAPASEDEDNSNSCVGEQRSPDCL